MKLILKLAAWTLYALAALWLAFGVYYVLTVPAFAASGAVMSVLFILVLLALPAEGARRLARR